MELEFPILVDPLGILTQEQEAALQKERGESNPEREELHTAAIMNKDQTILEDRKNEYKITPDHQPAFDKLANHTPAYALANNVLEFVSTPAQESSYRSREVIDAMYDQVDRVVESTSDLTARARLEGDVHVGPINTGGRQPKALKPRSNSIQVNIGVETARIPEFFFDYASSSELRDDKFSTASLYRGFLLDAVKAAVTLEEEIRKESGAAEPLLGLRGIFSILALYLYAGAKGMMGGGTVKNFTPLLLKTPIAMLADKTIPAGEARLFADKKAAYLKRLVSRTRGPDALITDLLVRDISGEEAGVKVVDMITSEYKAPFIVSGKSISPDAVSDPPKSSRSPYEPPLSTDKRRKGGVFESRTVFGDFDRTAAKNILDEMFYRVGIIHMWPDDDLMTKRGPSGELVKELDYTDKFKK